MADLLAWQQALRADASFTHLSSAIVRGWWLPVLPAPLPVWIAQDKAHNHTRRHGARVLRSRLAPEFDVTLDDLREVVGRRRSGVPGLRAAIALADGRSESAWESLLRVLHTSCGIEVEPQREFRHRGQFVARGDLWLVGTRDLHEYDGAEHRDRQRQQQDLRRDRRIARRLAVPG